MGIPRNIGRRELLLYIGRAAFAGQFALSACATARAQVTGPSMDEPIKLPPPAEKGTMSVEWPSARDGRCASSRARR